MTLPMSGGNPAGQIGTTPTGENAWGIAISSTMLYWALGWADFDGGHIAGASLLTLSATQPLTTSIYPMAIAINSTHFYVAGPLLNDRPVARMPLAGGSLDFIANSQQAGVGLALDATNVYWTNSVDPGTVMKAPLAGGTLPTPIASGQKMPSRIVVDGSGVYWTNNVTSGAIMKVALTGGAPVVIANGQNNPWDIATDATTIYWTNPGDGTVMKVAK
jgi:hypothetical protein